MAQQQKKQNRPKQPQDRYAQTAKQLASAVQRLRGWVGSDPSRTPELADALIALTRHRLLGHAYTAAAPEAQESVKLAAQLLTAEGPIGPYTSVDDAARYVTAVVHLAVIQSAAGMVEAGAETVGSLNELREQLGSLPLIDALPASTVVWALCCTARGVLQGGDTAQANAYADAILQRVAESGLREDAEAAYVVLDADRLVSDARWAGGLIPDALTHLHLARETYDSVVDGRLVQAARLSPVLRQRLAEPLYGLYRDLADRLLGAGEIDLGIVTRRQLVELLSAVAPQEETARVQLAASLTDLVRDLRTHGRDAEAELAAEELAALPQGDRDAAVELAGGVSRGQQPVRWEPLSAFAAYAAAGSRSAALSATEAQLQREVAARLAAEREEARRLAAETEQEARLAAERREAERLEAQRLAAEQAEAERLATERAEAERLAAEQAEAARLAAEEEAERAERKRRREERIEAHRLEQERLEAERLAAELREAEEREAARRAADPAAQEQFELERLQAELAELERIEREAEERAAAEAARRRAEEEEAARIELERLAEVQRAEARAAEERAKAEAWEERRREEERLEAERAEAARLEDARIEAARIEAEASPAEPAADHAEPVEDHPEPADDELTTTYQAWQQAKAQGDRKAARAHNERLVELLRPRAEQNLTEYGPRLLYALEELSSARLRAGELFASRGPAREAKTLAKSLGRR
ncbi:MAG: hypothetical protein QM650_08675 [Microlunatus sp.]